MTLNGDFAILMRARGKRQKARSATGTHSRMRCLNERAERAISIHGREWMCDARSVAVQLTVHELLKRCMQRPPDEDAWREFVQRYHPTIRASVAKAFRIRANQESDRRAQFPEDSIEDLVQAVYVRVVEEGTRALGRFEGQHENSIFQYLGIISINVVRDHFREAKAQKRPKISFSLDELLENAGEGGILKEVLTGVDGPITGAESNLTMDDIEAALKRSVSRKHGDRDALIFKLRYFDGLTLEEIKRALALDLSPIGIGSILNRINAKLRPKLARFRRRH
jgi:RNA polymerase sigma factor (sigma-70 family)